MLIIKQKVSLQRYSFLDLPSLLALIFSNIAIQVKVVCF